MVFKFNKAALPDPVVVHRGELAEHHGQEEREDPQVRSLCNSCKYGFRYSCRREWGDKDPKLAIFCTGPWFEHAYQTHGVTACNGYVEGEFSPVAAMMETVEKALDVDPYEWMSDEQKAAALDAELADLEGEGDAVEKGMETDEGDDDPSEDDGNTDNNGNTDNGEAE